MVKHIIIRRMTEIGANLIVSGARVVPGESPPSTKVIKELSDSDVGCRFPDESAGLVIVQEHTHSHLPAQCSLVV